MRESKPHFGDWVRKRILELDVFPSQFASILGVKPYPIHDFLNRKATLLLPADVHRLASELSLPTKIIEAAMFEAWEAENDGRPDSGLGRRLKAKAVSIFQPITQGRLPSECGLPFAQILDADVDLVGSVMC